MKVFTYASTLTDIRNHHSRLRIPTAFLLFPTPKIWFFHLEEQQYQQWLICDSWVTSESLESPHRNGATLAGAPAAHPDNQGTFQTQSCWNVQLWSSSARTSSWSFPQSPAQGCSYQRVMATR